MSAPRVIIFGATGGVGSVAARAARERGAHVILAMRDTEKAIPGLDATDEAKLGFERVYADLSKPETIHAAVVSTKATRAFFYLIWASPDGMDAAFAALKNAGITDPLFLSSGAVPDDKATVEPTNMIGMMHTLAEDNLEKHFGPTGYYAVRPGYFASNAFRWKPLFENGKSHVPYPQAYFDWISPSDIGRVCGSLLATGMPTDRQYVRLSGPELLSQGAVIGKIGKVVGKNVELDPMTHDGAVQFYVERAHMPQPASVKLVAALKARADEGEMWTGPDIQEGATNVKIYSGQEATNMDTWVEENKNVFLSWDI